MKIILTTQRMALLAALVLGVCFYSFWRSLPSMPYLSHEQIAFVVSGAVISPGAHQFSAPAKISDAIRIAQPKPEAMLKRVTVSRGCKIFTIDCGPVKRGDPFTFLLENKDVIRVPEVLYW